MQLSLNDVNDVLKSLRSLVSLRSFVVFQARTHADNEVMHSALISN